MDKNIDNIVFLMLSFTQKYKKIILEDSKYCNIYKNGFLEDVGCCIPFFKNIEIIENIKNIETIEKLKIDIENLKNNIKSLNDINTTTVLNILDKFDSIRQILFSIVNQ